MFGVLSAALWTLLAVAVSLEEWIKLLSRQQKVFKAVHDQFHDFKHA
jgi:hypothetical protein